MGSVSYLQIVSSQNIDTSKKWMFLIISRTNTTSNKIHLFYTNKGITRLKLVKNGSVKTIIHINNFKDLFADTDVDSS